jgi:hypothetical protein
MNMVGYEYHEDDIRGTCFYCGLPASTIDHVIPISYIEQILDIDGAIPRPLYKVSACTECNCLSSSNVFNSIDDKKAFVKRRLKRRYAKYLNMPHWDQSEINKLGYNLKSNVLNANKIKEQTQKRLQYA